MPTDLDYVMNPDTEGFAGLQATADPTGGSNPSVHLMVRDETGALKISGLVMQRHGSAGIRFLRVNGGAADVMAMDAGGHVQVADAF